MDAPRSDNFLRIKGEDGFSPISNKIRYPKIPDTLKLTNFADTLLQIYNVRLAYTSLLSDINTVGRFIDVEVNFDRSEYVNALNSIRLYGIKIDDLKVKLKKFAKEEASSIRKCKFPESDETAAENFHNAYTLLLVNLQMIPLNLIQNQCCLSMMKFIKRC